MALIVPAEIQTREACLSWALIPGLSSLGSHLWFFMIQTHHRLSSENDFVPARPQAVMLEIEKKKLALSLTTRKLISIYETLSIPSLCAPCPPCLRCARKGSAQHYLHSHR